MRRETGEERGERREEREGRGNIEEDKEEEMKRRASSFGEAFLKPFCFAKVFTENTSSEKKLGGDKKKK